MIVKRIAGWATLVSLAFPGLALAQDKAVLSSGDTAWMLTSSALVLFMTVPGLALFYGGMVRSKNVLSVLVQCFAITGLVTVLWVLYGYSLVFDTTDMAPNVTNLHSLIGGLKKAFLLDVTQDSLWQTFPESVWVMFQMTFAIITPALIVGAFAERMKFPALLLFMALWFTFCYAPIAHMVWSGDGSLLGGNWGVLDFAGGTVVHINAGVAGLVACLVIGKRKGYGSTPMAPHNLAFTLTGAAMLWIGWFGFNAGSAGAADGTAGMAMLVTQIATGTAALGWMLAEWLRSGKPSALGIASGVVAGLVAITPAAGTVGPIGAIAIGAVASVLCYFAVTVMKGKLGYDDALDAFGVHGVGGLVGAILTGVFASPSLGGFGKVQDIGAQVGAQLAGCIFTIVYTGVVSYIILKVVDVLIGLRVSDEDESQGLDSSEHYEQAYN